jgi:catechol 2,3-dioxygenase-like lactoylglutathione lyase family enzyme
MAIETRPPPVSRSGYLSERKGGRRMFDHISIGAHDIARSKAFYDAALQAIGYRCLSQGDYSLGYGKEAVGFWIGATNFPGPRRSEVRTAFLFRGARS